MRRAQFLCGDDDVFILGIQGWSKRLVLAPRLRDSENAGLRNLGHGQRNSVHVLHGLPKVSTLSCEDFLPFYGHSMHP